MMSSSIEQIRQYKRQLRNFYKDLRNNLDDDYRKHTDEEIFKKVVTSASYKYSDTILLYASFKGEVDTWKLFERALSDGKNVCFPKTYKDGIMKFFKVTGKEEMQQGNFGVLEPQENDESIDFSHALCIVPALSVDLHGNRLGYGKGFYDRFLSKFDGISACLEYDKCVCLQKLPSEKRYDKKVDILITEKKVYVFGFEKE